MRYVAIILFSLTVCLAKSQSDTIVIIDEPLIINKEVFYSVASTPIQKTLLIGAGTSLVNGYQNYTPSLTYINSINGIALSTELLLRKGNWIASLGVGYNQTTYQNQQNSIETITNEQSKVISDTTLTYDIKWREDIYYPSGGFFDTTYIYTIHTSDSSYTTSKDTIVLKTNTYKRKYIELPVSLGYQFNSNKIQFIVTATITPSFMLNKDEKSFLLLYGGSFSALYEITKKIKVGPRIQAQKIVSTNETVSFPRQLYTTKILFSYAF